MAQLIYRGVELKILVTRDIVREPILTEDGTTLLYLKHTIDVQCLYNPEATSIDPGNGTIGTSGGAAFPGFMPPETDAGIRQTLLQPQGQLIFRDDDGRLILRSPAVGYTVDARNGPFPEVCEVTRVHGTKTWQVHFRITTYVNECRVSRSSTNPLLSHRWRRYVDHDQDYFATVITEGEAVFNTAELLRLGTYPDQYRQDLFHAIPNNFKRDKITVIPDPDGSRLRYVIHDRETAFNLPIRNVTRIEAYQTGHFGSGSVLGAFMNQGLNNSGGGVTGFFTNVARALVPKYSMHVMCRVWGNRQSIREGLRELAIAVAIIRCTPPPGVPTNLARTQEIIVTDDLAGKFAECQYTVSWGIEHVAAVASGFVGQTIAQITGQAVPDMPPSGLDALRAFYPLDETIRWGGGTVLTQQEGFRNAGPPNAKETRGTWLGRLVAQVLAEPCAIPDQAPATRAAINQKTVNLDLY